MLRNDEYWGGAQSRPAGFEHHYVPDGRARLNALRSGQANVVLIDPRQIPEAKSAGLTVQVNEKNGVWDIYVNLSRAPLNDLKVRQAFMRAVDRAALAEAHSFRQRRCRNRPCSCSRASSPITTRAPDALYPVRPEEPSLLAEALGERHRDHPAAAEHDRIQTARQALQAMLAESGTGEVRRGGRLPVQPVPAGAIPRRIFLMARLGRTGGPAETFRN
jgi:ABC-type transport system substrate-binding protein